MAVKLVIVLLAALTIAAAATSERMKRQTGNQDFTEFFNKFQEQMKPIAGQFPPLPSGFGTGTGSFPGFPGTGGSSTGNSQYKRQATPNDLTWLGQFQELGNNFSGNLPFKPPTFGQFPGFPGSSGSSSESTNNQNP